MLTIQCPLCGPRAETEFTYGGEANIVRPSDSPDLSDRQWGDYVFMRRNTCGNFREQWLHAQGCRRWFIVERDTRTYAFTETPQLAKEV